MLDDRPAEHAGCHECGTTVCRSCALEIEGEAYCRWCATLMVASA
jgi:hypothetical protein